MSREIRQHFFFSGTQHECAMCGARFLTVETVPVCPECSYIEGEDLALDEDTLEAEDDTIWAV